MTPSLIDCDPGVMMGKPVVTGSRVTVELILEQLAAGRSADDILASYPRLDRESISAALGYAAKTMNEVWKQSAIAQPA